MQTTYDVMADTVIFKHLKSSGVVAKALSAEKPWNNDLTSGGKYMVTFRPFNGATVIDCNFATASIFAVWRETTSLDGKTGRDLAGAACAVYGSRTSLVTYNTQNDRVEELTILRMGEKERWIVTTPEMKIGPKATLFAPALKSSFEYPNYLKIFTEFCMRGYSIRYSGAAACDIY